MKPFAYTAIVNDYDRLNQAPDDVPAYAFLVDSPKALRMAESQGWYPLPFTKFSTDPAHPARRTARFLKTLGYLLLPKASSSIWLDGSLSLKVSSHSLIEPLRAARTDIGVYPHPDRNCLYDEVDACIGQNKDLPDLLRWQSAYYRELGFPAAAGLPVTGILVRRHTPATLAFCCSWWEQLCLASCRDQISFPFVWKNSDAKVTWFEGTPSDVADWRRHGE